MEFFGIEVRSQIDCDNKILGILKLHVMVDSWKRREEDGPLLAMENQIVMQDKDPLTPTGKKLI